MSIYTVGDVVVALGVSATTVRNWTEETIFEPYLSHQATRTGEFEHSKQREYTEEDLYVLNTIRTQKTRVNSWEDVASKLEDGFRDRNLPEGAALVLPETRAEAFQLVSVARQQIEALQNRVDELEADLKKERQARLEDAKAVGPEKEALLKTIGKLEAYLTIHGIDPKTGKPSDAE